VTEDALVFQRGDVILREGDSGDVAYLLQTGSVEIYRGEAKERKTLGVIKPGGVFGEMALIDPAPRLASAVALEQCDCRAITRQALERALDLAPPLARYLLQSILRNIRTASGLRVKVAAVDPDGGAIKSERQGLRVLDRKAFASGEVIFRQNSDGHFAYLIQTGEVDLQREELDGRIRQLRRLGPGEVFGEMALLDGGPRFATAIAMSGLSAEVIRADHFNQLLNESPPIVRALIRIYARMIRSHGASGP
jgi:cAMP-dependent protein kinase regulator